MLALRVGIHSVLRVCPWGLAYTKITLNLQLYGCDVAGCRIAAK
jgi:hypothetical protein